MICGRVHKCFSNINCLHDYSKRLSLMVAGPLWNIQSDSPVVVMCSFPVFLQVDTCRVLVLFAKYVQFHSDTQLQKPRIISFQSYFMASWKIQHMFLEYYNLKLIMETPKSGKGLPVNAPITCRTLKRVFQTDLFVHFHTSQPSSCGMSFNSLLHQDCPSRRGTVLFCCVCV